MDERIQISVIVPAYNTAQWLSSCLNSIINQTYKNLEIIVINDGSTDATAEIVEKYANMDKRIIAVHQENMGLVAVREKGISMATGQYVTFVDADDSIEQDMYERLLNNAIKYNADISHCGMNFCYSDGREEKHYATGKIVVQDNFSGVKDLLEGKFIEPSLCNKLYRASLLPESCLDLNILNNEDLLRNFVLFERAQISVFEDFCGYRYMQREGSMSKTQKKQIEIADYIIRVRKLIVEHSSKDVYPYAMQTWLSAVIMTINQMTFSDDEAVKKYCKYCREILKREKKNFCYLIKRQQIAAKLILTAPWLHRLIYSIYKKRYK